MQITPNTKLNEWSADWIRHILDNDEGEGLLYDFKEDLSGDNYNIRKAVISFANTFGGFLIFGIKDKRNNLSGWARFCGVKNTNNFAKELTNKISGKHVIPNIFFEGPQVIEVKYNDSILNVIIVKIESSSFKPHALLNDGELLEFWMRGNSSAVAMSYPHLTKTIEESLEVRNWLAALYLDTEYVDSFADKMVIPEKDRGSRLPVVQIKALINSEQSSQVISRIPTDIELIKLIWLLKEKIDIINSFRDMMIQRRSLPLTNSEQENRNDNNSIAIEVPQVKKITIEIRKHLLNKYSGIREWISVVQNKKEA